ncbi:hypothetical protein, conserved [Eimeria tenella]|uniref:Uncharacterized protein n=1 Tax=Eimeria tenella TaxID=5802 RepID=U6KST7_EIMTE|nr:hypothetical protein, conserved [Eimeria tenella]CDJ38493.1 hypothetical protein, conserved [Eimeria tenella]|eukprot:XP_013229331.1 hypothetical protein, conserved [Eimeria tenella]
MQQHCNSSRSASRSPGALQQQVEEQQKQQQREHQQQEAVDPGYRLWEGNKRKVGSENDVPRDTADWDLLRSWLPPQLRKSQQKKLP